MAGGGDDGLSLTVAAYARKAAESSLSPSEREEEEEEADEVGDAAFLEAQDGGVVANLRMDDA